MKERREEERSREKKRQENTEEKWLLISLPQDSLYLTGMGFSMGLANEVPSRRFGLSKLSSLLGLGVTNAA